MSVPLEDPVFDELIYMALEDVHEEDAMALVIHRDPMGEEIVWHSPLDNGALKCRICEGGARVYIRGSEDWEKDA